MRMDPNSIISDITSVTKKWTKQRKAEERRASAVARRASLYRRTRPHATEAAAAIMEEAYRRVSWTTAGCLGMPGR